RSRASLTSSPRALPPRPSSTLSPYTPLFRSAPGLPEHLVARYGTDAAKVAAYGDADPSLNEPVRQGIPLTGAEVRFAPVSGIPRSEEHTSELQSRFDLVCRLLLEKKKQTQST